MRILSIMAISLCIFVLVGCGGPVNTAPATIPVSGSVQLDGAPLASGEITFTVEGEPPQVAPIVEGAYTGAAVAGENVVQVSSFKDGPDDGTGLTPKINIIPRKFNYDSTLKADVTNGGANKFDFEVTSK